jgi:hypothetical protein
MMRELSLDLFGEMFAAFGANKGAEDKKLAIALAEDAGKHADEGERQQGYAKTAKDSIRRAMSAESRTELVRIAAWHFEKCARSFRASAVGFESAAKLQKRAKARRKFLQQAAEMTRLAAQADLAICEIDEFLQKGTVK